MPVKLVKSNFPMGQIIMILPRGAGNGKEALLNPGPITTHFTISLSRGYFCFYRIRETFSNSLSRT